MTALRAASVLQQISSHQVRDALAPFVRARALQAAPVWAVRGFVAGVVVDLLALATGLVAAAAPLPFVPSWVGSFARAALTDRLWLPVLPLALALGVSLAAYVHRLPARGVAREADSLLDLAERISTALELEERAADGRRRGESRGDGQPLLVALQRADALDRLRRAEPLEVFPIHLSPRQLLAAGMAALVMLALVVLPDLTAEGYDRSRVAEVARLEAERLEALADELAALEDLPESERTALVEALQLAAQELEQQAERPTAAMASIGQAERSLLSQEDASGADRELALARVADALDQTASGKEAARLLDRRQYAAAGAELEKLGRESSGLSSDEQKSLAEALQRAANSTSKLDSSLSQRLQEAASAVGSPQAEQSMAQAADEVRRAGQEAQSQRMVERALAALQDARQAIGRASSEPGSSAQARQQPGQPGAGLPPLDGAAAADPFGEGDGGEGAGGGPPGEGAQAGSSGPNGEGAGLPGSGAGTGSLRARGEGAREDFRSRQVRVPTEGFERPQVSPGEQLDEGPIGEAVVDYQQVLPEYRERATEAMAQRYVPPGLKELVRDYFSSLDARR